MIEWENLRKTNQPFLKNAKSNSLKFWRMAGLLRTVMKLNLRKTLRYILGVDTVSVWHRD